MAAMSNRNGSVTTNKAPRPCPFAQALLDFVDEEINKADNKKGRFSTEVLEVARQLKNSKKPFEDSSLSAAALMECISELEGKQRKRSKVRRISSRLKPLVQGLSQYTCIVDAMIQADPTPGALIYGGAKLVLQLASGFSNYFEKVIDMMSGIGDRLLLFDTYSLVYSWSEPVNKALVKSYKSILSFWKNAAKLFTQRGITIFGRGLFKPFDVEYEALLAGLERDASSVESAAKAAHAIASLRHEQAQAHEQEANKRDRIISWLSASYSKTHYERYQSLRHPETCEWLLNHDTFISWDKSQKNEILWLHAIPGAGKSVLCSRVIEKMGSEGKEVVYFFFMFDEPAKSQRISMLRSLIVQLLALLPQVPDDFCNICESERMIGQSFLENPTVAEKLINTLLKRIPRVHVVIDGLDECSDRPELLKTLGRLFRQSSFGIVKWFCASRDEVDIRATFGLAHQITVGDSTQPDIERFLDEDPYFAENEDQNHVILPYLSGGSFLWVKLTLDVLRGKGLTCKEDIKVALASFYPGLQGCYLRTLQQLTTKSSKEQELARKIFTFVTLASYPLTFNELSEALSVRIDMIEPDEGRVPHAVVVEELCCPLIVLDRTESNINPTLRLAHKTIGEFLVQNPEELENIPKACWKFFIKPHNASLEVGRVCLTYLSYTRYTNPVDLEIELKRGSLKKHAFLRYAAIFWHQHLSHGKGTRALFDQVSQFLRSCNFWTCMQVQSLYAPYIFARLVVQEKETLRITSPDEAYRQSCEDFYPDALPGWLTDFGDEGKFLVRAYQLFVMEWGVLLIRHPGKINLCCSATLGRHDFFSKPEWSSKTRTPLALECDNDSSCESGGNVVSAPAATRLISFELLDTGLHATVANFRPDSELVLVTLQHWLLSISAGNSAPLNLEKRVDFSTLNLLPSAIREASNDPGPHSSDSPTITFEKAKPVITTAIKPGILSIGDTPIDIYRISGDTEQVSKIDFAAAKTVKGFMARKGKDWVLRNRQITCQGSTVALAFRLSGGQVSSFVDSGYGAGDSDDSEDEALANVNCIAVFNGNGDDLPFWFESEDDNSILRQSPPVFHPTKPLTIWPIGDSSLLLINYTTGISQNLIAVDGKYPSDRRPIARGTLARLRIFIEVTYRANSREDIHISGSGTKIHEAVVRRQNVQGVVTWTVESVALDLSIQSDDPATARVTRSSSCTTKVSWSSGISGSYNAINSPELPCSFTWTENHLYIAFGSYEVNVCRFSLPKDGMTESVALEPTVERLQETMFLPASAGRRGVRFFCHSADEVNYGIFALGGTAEMAPVVFVRHIDSDLGGWNGLGGEDTMVLNGEHNNRSIKGIYAAGQPSFSVPVRSSLAWQKRSYVTCY